MSPVPRELSPIIPHTETSAGIDRRYAASFLEMQQVILSDALKSWPMRHHTVYRCQDESGKLMLLNFIRWQSDQFCEWHERNGF